MYSQEYYKNKYLKYKNKYLELKNNQIGGEKPFNKQLFGKTINFFADPEME